MDNEPIVSTATEPAVGPAVGLPSLRPMLVGAATAATLFVLLLALVFKLTETDDTAQAVEDLQATTGRLVYAVESLEIELHRMSFVADLDKLTPESLLGEIVPYSTRISRLASDDPQTAIDMSAGLGQAFVCSYYETKALTDTDWWDEVALASDWDGSRALQETFRTSRDFTMAAESLAWLGCPDTVRTVKMRIFDNAAALRREAAAVRSDVDDRGGSAEPVPVRVAPR